MRALISAVAIFFGIHATVTQAARPDKQRRFMPRPHLLAGADGIRSLVRVGKNEAAKRKGSLRNHFDGQESGNETFDDAVQTAVQKAVGEELEKKMKFFPGMSSIEQLLAWNLTVAGPRMGPAKDLPHLRSGPRVLSMHDMAGGYSELADNDYLMMFKSWKLVDIFVYFSHVRVSVPPLQWTATAHEHHRPALGTLILENSAQSSEAAALIKRRQPEVLEKLVQVADHYGFDGWFVNVEDNSFSKGDAEELVKELKLAMHKQLGQRSLVIAYPYGPGDSMFGLADGVFMQYNWPSDDASMRHLATLAGNRSQDVYMGMDAYGGLRGNTQPDPDHVRACASHNLSVAVFAPGYTLEKTANSTLSTAAVDIDHRFWRDIGRSFLRPH